MMKNLSPYGLFARRSGIFSLLCVLTGSANPSYAAPPANAAPTDLSARLVDAIRAGDNARLTSLLAKGANLNTADANLSTPLMQACATAPLETVRLLIEKGASPRARDNKGFTPLLIAAYAGRAPIVQLLLDSAGADANDADSDRHTALMGAAYSGQQAVIKLLLDKGADVRAADKDGFTPLMVAAGKANPESVRLLLDKGADANAATVVGFTPLMQASGAGNADVVQLLLDRGADARRAAQKGATALLVASYAGNVEIATRLMNRGADINVADAVGHTPLVGASYAGSVPVVELLLRKGAKIETPTRAGLTALMQAAYSGRVEVVKVLLAWGATVDSRTTHGLTALMQAAGTGSQPACLLLLQYGADINAADDTGQTAATWARKRGHEELLPFLRTAGARTVPEGVLASARAARDKAVKEAGTDKTALADIAPLPKDGNGVVPPPAFAPIAPRFAELTKILPAAPEAAPVLLGPRVIGGSPGKPFLYRIGATGKGTLRFGAVGLPSGLTVSAQTGLITGKIAAPGTYKATLSVSVSGKTATRPLTIVCAPKSVSLTPPMGWSAWSLYGETISADKIRLQADWLVKSGLAAHGFTYLLLDDTWQGRRLADTGDLPPNRRVGDIAALAAYCHERGLKFGLYSSPNAETPAGYAGSLGHEEQDAKQWAEWGIDYLKYDWSDSTRGKFDVKTEELKAAFGKMRTALDKQNRDIHFAVTPYGFGGVTDWGTEAGANSWWTSQQVIESWEGMTRNGFDLSFRASEGAKPGHWNDPGWLLLGRVGGAEINPHFTKLSVDEQKTQISLWSITAAPLILSCDLTQLDPNRFFPVTTALLTNDEVLEIDQDPLGKPGGRVKSEGRVEIWTRPLWDGTIAVGFFNREYGERTVRVVWSELAEVLGRTLTGSQPVRDLWKRADLAPASEGGVSATVPPHGVVLLKIGKPAAP